MRGGPSAMETFEHKPELYKRAGEERPGKRKLVGNNWDWKQRGQSGLWISALFPHLAGVADELTVIRSMFAETSNHTPATFQMPPTPSRVVPTTSLTSALPSGTSALKSELFPAFG